MTIRKSDARVLPPGQWAQVAYQEGFRGEALVNMVAVIGAESGFDAHAVGDVDLTEPGEQSTGGAQVHYRPSRDGRPEAAGIRNPHLNFDPAFNMRAAYRISRGGTNFMPWTNFKNGKYRKHLDVARQAATGAAGFRTDPATPATTPTDPTPIAYRGAEPAPGLPIRLGGLALRGEVGDAVVGGKVDLTSDEVSEVELEFNDPQLTRLSVGRLSVGTPLDLLDLHFTVVKLDVIQGPADPHLRLIAHPTGAVRMREGVPGPAKNLSPTDYMAMLARAVGLEFLGEPSGVRADIGPNTIKDKRGRVTDSRLETAWEIGKRLAAELGFLAFEAAGTYHFASAARLVDSGRTRHVFWGADPGPSQSESSRVKLLRLPTCSAQRRPGVSAFSHVDVDGTDALPRAEGVAFRPGENLLLSGVPRFSGKHRMITRVSWSLDDLVSPVTVTASSVERLTPANDRTAEDDRAALPGGIQMEAAIPGGTKRGTRSALDFVTFCLQQVGDKYVFGAETRPDDLDPDAFDCSELIQWACAQVGVDFVDGSGNQIAAVQRAGLLMPVEQAARVRGAVLFRPGSVNHIAVSLGDGKHTVEARGRKYGVVQHVIANRGWTKAGRIPGLIYG